MSSNLTAAEDATARRVVIVGDLPADTRQRVTDLLASQGIVVIAEARAESLIDQLRDLPLGTPVDDRPFDWMLGPEVLWPPEPPPLPEGLIRSLELPPLPPPPPGKPNRQQRRAADARRRGSR